MWKKRKSVRRRSIYRKYVSWSRLQKCGTKFKWGRSLKHWPRGSPGQWVPETEYLRASAIFVSGTSGITPILNYRSVSPIPLCLDKQDFINLIVAYPLTLCNYPLYLLPNKSWLKTHSLAFVIFASSMSLHSFIKVCRIDIFIGPTIFSSDLDTSKYF